MGGPVEVVVPQVPRLHRKDGRAAPPAPDAPRPHGRQPLPAKLRVLPPVSPLGRAEHVRLARTATTTKACLGAAHIAVPVPRRCSGVAAGNARPCRRTHATRRAPGAPLPCLRDTNMLKGPAAINADVDVRSANVDVSLAHRGPPSSRLRNASVADARAAFAELFATFWLPVGRSPRNATQRLRKSPYGPTCAKVRLGSSPYPKGISYPPRGLCEPRRRPPGTMPEPSYP